MTWRLLVAGILTVIALVLWASTTAQKDSPRKEQTPAQIAASTHMVARVLDGDTIVLAGGDKVRYIGIDTPELYGGSNSECFALEAQKRNTELVLGKRVRLEGDVSETDKYGRLLRYVYISDPASSISENTSINEILVREGYAHAVSFPPDVAQQGVLHLAETSAREGKNGLWADDACKAL